jgi:hypothetical protein
MSFQERIDAALAIIKEHNDALGQDSSHVVDGEKVIACIKASGGTSEDRLASLSHEDILECLPAVKMPGESGGFNVKPRILAKAIAGVFRSKGDTAQPDAARPVSAKKAERMTPAELVASFDPEDANNAVGERLAKMSKGHPFVVYLSGRTVDTTTTLKLLLEIRQGYEGRADVDVPGRGSVKVYKLGELPENFADENPLYRGRPLRPDGTCDQTGRSWEGVPLEVRQLVRVAIDVNELKVSHETAHDLLDTVMADKAMEKVRRRYRKASVRFDELAGIGDLPKLKIALGAPVGGSERKGPFDGGRQVQWASNRTPIFVFVGPDGGTYTTNTTEAKWRMRDE